MDLDFKEPSLKLKYLLNDAIRNRNKDDLRSYLVEKNNFIIYKKCIEEGILDYKEDDINIIQNKSSKILENLESLKANEPENDQNIFDMNKKICEFYAQVMDLDKFETSFADLKKSGALSPSLMMDIYMCKIRISIINDDYNSLEKNIREGNVLFDETYDWDRKNRFKIYKGLFLMINGNFYEAATLFYEGIASFDANELFPFDKLILYFVFCAIITFSRHEIKEKILQNADVLKCHDIIKIVEIYYNCNYEGLFDGILEFIDKFSDDVFIGHYKNYFCCEMKILGYKQLLSSYLSFSIEKMASVFKILPDDLEADLRYFISENRLPFLIDKINGVVQMVKENKMDNISSILNEGNNILTLIRKQLN